MRFLSETTSLQPFASSFILFCLLPLSLSSPVRTQIKWLQGKLLQSKLVHLSSSSSQLTESLQTPLLSAEVSQSIRHEQLIRSHQSHLSLRSAAFTGQSGERVQRVLFSVKPSSRWQKKGKNGAYWRPI